MSTSMDFEKLDFKNEDYELLAGIMITLARAREGLKKAMPTRGNLPTLVPLDITCFLCNEK